MLFRSEFRWKMLLDKLPGFLAEHSNFGHNSRLGAPLHIDLESAYLFVTRMRTVDGVRSMLYVYTREKGTESDVPVVALAYGQPKDTFISAVKDSDVGDRLHWEWIIPDGDNFRVPFQGPGYWNAGDQNTLTEEITGVRKLGLNLIRSKIPFRDSRVVWPAEGRLVELESVLRHVDPNVERQTPFSDEGGNGSPGGEPPRKGSASSSKNEPEAEPSSTNSGSRSEIGRAHV